MQKDRTKKVALFICHDLMGLLILNRLVPRMIDLGIFPVIYNTGLQRNREFKIPTPPIVAFCNALLLSKTVLPILDKQSDGGNEQNYSFKALAKRYDIEYHEIADVNAPSFLECLKSKDLIGAISIRFLQLFEDPIIRFFKEKGFMWNLHSGLLPKYKGLLIPYHAIINKEKDYGLTLHEIVVKIDEGDIIEKKSLLLNPKKPILTLYLDLVPVGVEIILNALSSIKSNKIVMKEKEKQSSLGKSYFQNPTSSDFRNFIGKGYSYVDVQGLPSIYANLFAQKNSKLHLTLQAAVMESLMNASSQGSSANSSAIKTTINSK